LDHLVSLKPCQKQIELDVFAMLSKKFERRLPVLGEYNPKKATEG